jgi:hypothetical protein
VGEAGDELIPHRQQREHGEHHEGDEGSSDRQTGQVDTLLVPA